MKAERAIVRHFKWAGVFAALFVGVAGVWIGSEVWFVAWGTGEARPGGAAHGVAIYRGVVRVSFGHSNAMGAGYPIDGLWRQPASVADKVMGGSPWMLPRMGARRERAGGGTEVVAPLWLPVAVLLGGLVWSLERTRRDPGARAIWGSMRA